MQPHIVIISPALAKANNGNGLTASRWARFLRQHYRVTLALHWDGTPCDAMIALHAWRSAPSIAAFAAACPTAPLILALTGTDLYRDIHTDRDAQRSLQLATQLIVLQPAGLLELSPDLQRKAQVIYQSAPSLKPVSLSIKQRARYFNVVMIGHFRDEKDPLTFMRAAAHISPARVRLTHIGGALDPLLGSHAQTTQAAHSHYRWLGHIPHAATRQRLKRSHLMVIASVMEGGAHVIIEAVTSGVPVLASDVSGNRGMLGNDYAGYFPLGDSEALARLIERAASEQTFYVHLQAQCDARAALFTPQRERAALMQLVDNYLRSKVK
jgi:putative glycosyltransferase (TIGR04348 family)